MLFIDLVRRSIRSLVTAKTRTLLTSFAIAVGAFALTLTLAASNGANNYADVIVKDNFNPSELIVTADASLFSARDSSKPQVYDSSFGSVTNGAGASEQIKQLDQADLDRLAAINGVSSVRPSVSLNLQYITRDGQRKYIATAKEYSAYKAPDLLAGSVPSSIKNGSLILPEGFLGALGFSNAQNAIGKTVRLAVQMRPSQSDIASTLTGGASNIAALTQPKSKEKTFTIIAVLKKPSTLVQPGTALNLQLNRHDTLRLNDLATKGTDSYHKYVTAYIDVKNGSDESMLKAVQSNVEKAGYYAQSVLDTEKIITQVISVLQGIVTVFGVIALIASVFGVVNTMYISVLQRTREIGLMKALGMHRRDIAKLFLVEAGLIGLLGGLLGSLLAVAAGTLLNPIISKQLLLGTIKLLAFQPTQIAVLVAILVLIAVIAGLLPARKASKLDPVEALRVE